MGHGTRFTCSGIQTTSRARRTCHRVGRYVYAHQGERPPPHAPTHELAEIIAPESPPLHSASTQTQLQAWNSSIPGNRLGWGLIPGASASHIPRDRHAIRDARTNTRTCRQAIALLCAKGVLLKARTWPNDLCCPPAAARGGGMRAFGILTSISFSSHPAAGF